MRRKSNIALKNSVTMYGLENLVKVRTGNKSNNIWRSGMGRDPYWGLENKSFKMTSGVDPNPDTWHFPGYTGNNYY